MRANLALVNKLVAFTMRHAVGRLFRSAARRLPRQTAVTGSLDDLTKPAQRLRRIQPIRIDGRSVHVVDLPARKMRTADLPALALFVRCENERTFVRTDQHSYP